MWHAVGKLPVMWFVSDSSVLHLVSRLLVCTMTFVALDTEIVSDTCCVDNQWATAKYQRRSTAAEEDVRPEDGARAAVEGQWERDTSGGDWCEVTVMSGRPTTAGQSVSLSVYHWFFHNFSASSLLDFTNRCFSFNCPRHVTHIEKLVHELSVCGLWVILVLGGWSLW